MSGLLSDTINRNEHVPLLRTNRTNSNLSHKRKKQITCGLILLTEILERCAFYSAIANFILFLSSEPLNWEQTQASNALYLLLSISSISALLSGWFADAFFGRFKTVAVCLFVYTIGYALLPALRPYPHEFKPDLNSTYTPPKWCVSHKDQDHVCGWAVYLCIAIIGIASGGVKSTLAPFGADQIKSEGPHATRVFFNWFYWCVNFGSFIAFGAFAYIQQEISFFWGLLIPSIFLLIAFLTFTGGSWWYTHRIPGTSILSNTFGVIVDSFKTRRRLRRQSINESSSSQLVSTDESCCSNLDYAKVDNGGRYQDRMVDDVKHLLKILLLFLSFIPYWVVYFQMETTFMMQGFHMKLTVNTYNQSDPNIPNDAFKSTFFFSCKSNCI